MASGHPGLFTLYRTGIVLGLIAAGSTLGEAPAAAPKPGQAGTTSAAQDTVVATESFELRLPGRWKEGHEPTHYRYFDDDRGEEVTVQIGDLRTALDDAKLESAAKELIAIRQRVMTTVSGGAAVFEPTRATSSPGEVEMTFTGIDPKNRVRFAVVLRGNPKRLATATYIKYAPFPTGDAFAARARSLLGTFRLR